MACMLRRMAEQKQCWSLAFTSQLCHRACRHQRGLDSHWVLTTLTVHLVFRPDVYTFGKQETLQTSIDECPGA